MTAYGVARCILRPTLRVFWRFKVVGAENIPSSGPLIVACNHVSYMDSVALGVACTRPIAYMAKAELFRIPILGPLILAFEAYPVERDKSATAAIKRSLQVLRRGGAIGIFPQGTRVRDRNAKAHTGVALLALLSGAPVVPATIIGSAQASHLGQIKVAFGTPVTFVTSSNEAKERASREELANWTDMIMRRIQTLEVVTRAH